MILAIGFLLALPLLALASPADEACAPVYAACSDAAQKLSGLITTPGTPSNTAWRACGQKTTACKESWNTKNNPTKPETKPTPSAVDSLVITGEQVSVAGDVDVSTDGGKTFKSWTREMTLKKGDLILTGFDSRVELTFPYGSLEVLPLTELRIDKYIEKENLKETQLNLRVGAVAARLKLPASIRADTSVTTPSAISSIRGSAMKVSYDKKTGTTIQATEGTTYWKKNGDEEHTLTAGQSVRIGLDEVVQTPGKPSNSSTPNALSRSSGCGKYPAKKVGKRLPAIVTASSSANGGSVCKANDGNETTWWIANSAAAPANNITSVQLDFGSMQNVGVLRWKGVAWDQDSYPGASPTHFKVESSNDGTIWQQVNEFGYKKKLEKKDKPMIKGDIFLVKPGGGQLKTQYLRLVTSQVNDGTGWALGFKEIWAE